MATDVVLSSYVQLIGLPTSADLPVGTILQISGFGVYQKGHPVLGHHGLSSNLRKLTISVIDRSRCQSIWSARFGNENSINQGQICTSNYDNYGLCNVSIKINIFGNNCS